MPFFVNSGQTGWMWLLYERTDEMPHGRVETAAHSAQSTIVVRFLHGTALVFTSLMCLFELYCENFWLKTLKYLLCSLNFP